MSKKWIFLIIYFCCLGAETRAQGLLLDLSVGTSLQDNVSGNIALRYQKNERFRIGVELQSAAPKYRFINAKPIREGYAFKFVIPTAYKLYTKDRLRLDLITSAGVRGQGVLDPDNNDKRDSLLNSTAIILNGGLIVRIDLDDRVGLQSGIMIPFVMQISPKSGFEALHGPMINAGADYKTTEQGSLFFNSQIGAAFGANGDTYKYSWSLQIGYRHAFGSQIPVRFVDPTFSF
jgi:hypothetical protein